MKDSPSSKRNQLPLLSIFQVAIAVVFVCAGGAWAQSGKSEATLAHWKFEGKPGTPFTSEGSGQSELKGGVAAKAGTNREPIYGEPSPNGGKSSLLLRNAGTSESDGGFASSEAAELIGGKNELTVEAWIKPTALRDAAVLRMRTTDGAGWVSLRTGEDGRFGFVMISGNGPIAQVVSDTGKLIAGEWQHVAATFQNGTLALYLNGEPVGKISSKDMLTIPDGFSLAGVGAYVRNMSGTSAASFFDGNIDEMRISGKALGSEEFLIGR